MATLTAYNPTLLDLTKRLAPDGAIDTIAELLAEPEDLLNYMTWVEGNLPTGHKTTVRTGLPAPTWRKLYGGVQPTKSTTAQITDTCGMLEAYAEVDKALADLNGNTASFRLSEERAHIQGMGIEFMDTLFGGDESTAPEEFTGFGPRFNSTTAENAGNLIVSESAPSTTATSIWLVVWSPLTVHGIYPKGSKVGLQMTDKGQVTVENATDYSGGAVGGGRFEAYRTHYRWDCGLTVRDWRYVARGYDINTAALTKSGGGTDLIDMMTRMIEVIPSLSMGRPTFICNRTIKSFLRRQIVNKVASSTLTMDQVAGKHVMTFDGIPVVRCDSILSNETTATVV